MGSPAAKGLAIDGSVDRSNSRKERLVRTEDRIATRGSAIEEEGSVYALFQGTKFAAGVSNDKVLRGTPNGSVDVDRRRDHAPDGGKYLTALHTSRVGPNVRRDKIKSVHTPATYEL